MKKVLKKYKLYILIIIVLVLAIFILIPKSNIKLKDYHNDYYSFKYSNNWHISKNKKEDTYLKSNKASLNIKLITLTDEYKYSNIDDILENIIYEFNSQNKEYSLISQTNTKLTKEAYSGYKLLYETKNNQAMINIIKNGERVILFIYESPNKYFDILLDSVQSIIYNFKFKPLKYNLETKIELDSKKITFSDNKELTKKLEDNEEYELASDNYYINYSLPNIFKRRTFDSTLGQFSYKDDKSELRVLTSIIKTNIYDYLDKESSKTTVYTDFKYIKENKDNSYSNFNEQLSKIKLDKYNGYIYKVTYTSKLYTEKNYDIYYIVIPLNKNHIFLIKVLGEGIKVSKEVIDSIKINSVKHYANYIKKDIDNGNLKIELKRFADIQDKEYETIELSIPEKYEEIDMNTNIYEYRYFGLNYDEENEVYQYEIKYRLTDEFSKEDSVISLANSSMYAYRNNANYKEFTYNKSLTIDDKTYKVYEAGYNTKGYVYGNNKTIEYHVNKKLVFTELDSGGYFVIEISGNDTTIDDKMITELAKFKIEKKEYK